MERRILPISQVGVEYSLTNLGESFRGPFNQIYEWALKNSDAIEDAQQRYDARQFE